VNRIGFFVTSILVVLALLSSTLFVVDQRQFGVVYALGQIKEVITEPGSTSSCRHRCRTCVTSTSVC
jgi:membrane protease subunit HflC